MPFDDFYVDALDYSEPEMLWIPVFTVKLQEWLERNPCDGPLR
jgi:hypothetical protein